MGLYRKVHQAHLFNFNTSLTMQNFNTLLFKDQSPSFPVIPNSTVEISCSFDENGQIEEFFYIARRKREMPSGAGSKAREGLPEGTGDATEPMGSGGEDESKHIVSDSTGDGLEPMPRDDEDKDADRGIPDDKPKTRGVGDGPEPMPGDEEDGG